jgi:cold shock protein
MQGNVKWFDKKKGYGFIISDDGKEYFVHFSNVEGEGFKSLLRRQKVEFELISTPNGDQASKVRVIEADDKQP